MRRQATYHHGDLPTALVDAALALVAEKGVAGLSVAAAARRAGVSGGAPYRHFASRTALLSAAATAAAQRLAEQMQAALAEVRRTNTARTGTPAAAAVEELAALARVYVRYALSGGPGFELIFADELQDFPDERRREATRRVFDLLLWPARTVTGHPAAAERLLSSLIAVVQGYAYLPRSGFMRGYATDADLLAAEAAGVVRTLARAALQGSPDVDPLPRPGSPSH